ncbi:SIR2 family protein [Idiomarina sp. PL1-037]|uniref:SIR2 family NAD-dependent protein deacylase n=1 Tax=Idiomarina sp. PL1-037 TaxID=3095365 RepID=UPI002ACBDF70|nr:SIR2 family protein [Idiomarina sp. PL1-037]WQC52091.1 SIR2 family protein [Idiomarina sp. PL1-037]
MSEFFEIAYAAANNRLCLFTGTGFSKSVSDNDAPSWQELLEGLCEKLPNPDEFKASIFPANEPSQLSLEEAAQVISIKLSAEGFNIHEEIAKVIRNLELKGDIGQASSFFSNRKFRVITTNYDKLSEELAAENKCQSITPGRPIPRASSNVKVYHVHGSTDSPDDMIVTSEDYFRFINSDSYFSRKLSTVLHENTVVILGYSLGDTNLKAIISDYKGFSKSHVISSNIFLISRSSVDQHVKDYYSHCYGIRVLDKLEVENFFSRLNEQIPNAEKIVDRSLQSLHRVVYEGSKFTEKFLKLDDSFYRIMSSLSAKGLSLKDEQVVTMIGDIIEAKRKHTQEPNAWEQYEHLAGWLAYLASITEIEETPIKEQFLETVLHSMTTMRNEYYIGYSWHAYKVWKNRWPQVIAPNRSLIKQYIKDSTDSVDALEVVNSVDT